MLGALVPEGSAEGVLGVAPAASVVAGSVSLGRGRILGFGFSTTGAGDGTSVAELGCVASGSFATGSLAGIGGATGGGLGGGASDGNAGASGAACNSGLGAAGLGLT